MSDVIVVKSFEHIEAVVNELPRVQPGKVRVYRGQTRQYLDALGSPILLPAIARPGRHRRYDLATLATVTDALIRGEVGDELPRDISLQWVWAAALVQHYASGSSFLDVSADLTVALWFCANREQRRVVLTNDGSEFDRRHILAWHTEWNEGDLSQPVLYVFDVAPWGGSKVPAHGQLVGLLDSSVGKLVASQASRLIAQRAELIYADVIHRSNSNLAEFLRCTFQLSPDFPYDSVPGIGRSTTALFPEPSVDPFYRHLLGFPGTVTFESGSALLSHPLEIARYIDKSKLPAATSDSAAVLECPRPTGPFCMRCCLLSEKIELANPLFHAYLSGNVPELFEPSYGLDVGSGRFTFRDAAIFLLRSPVMKWAPALHTKQGACNWIQSILWKDIAPEIPGAVGTNVYLELSPLDIYRIDRAGREMAIRAWWLVCNHPHYAVTLFTVVPDRGLYIYSLQFHYDSDKGIFIWIDPTPSIRKEYPEGKQFVVTTGTGLLFIGLMLLRHLSPGFKIPPAHPIEPEGYETFFLRLLRMPPKRTLTMLIEPQIAKASSLDRVGQYLIPEPLDGDSVYIGPSHDAGWLDAINIRDLLQLIDIKLGDVKEQSFLAFARSLLALEWAKAGERDHAITHTRKASQAADIAGLELIKKTMDLFANLVPALPINIALDMIASVLDAPADSAKPGKLS